MKQPILLFTLIMSQRAMSFSRSLLFILIGMLQFQPPPAQGQELKLSKIKAIEASGSKNEQYFAFIRDIHHFNSQWIISDFSTEKVFVLNQNLNFQRYLGGKGKGPGEFVKPTWIFSNEDTLYLVDDFGWKILKYDKNGEPLGHVRINSDSYHGNQMVRYDDWFYTTYYCSDKPIRKFDGQTVRGLPEDGKAEKIINYIKEKALTNQRLYELRADLFPYNNDQLLKVYYYQPRVEVYDIQGNLLKQIDIAPSHFSESILKSNLKEYKGSKKEPDYIRLTRWSSLDDGRLFMLINDSNKKHPKNKILIVKIEDGKLISTFLPEGTNYRQFTVHGNRLLAFNHDLASLELFELD